MPIDGFDRRYRLRMFPPRGHRVDPLTKMISLSKREALGEVASHGDPDHTPELHPRCERAA